MAKEKSQGEPDLGLNRLIVRALGLLVLIPFVTMLVLFWNDLQGKWMVLVFLFACAALGFYLLWTVVRAISSIQKGLERIARGESRTLDLDQAPGQLREMAEIVNALNQLTVEFKENASQLEGFISQFAALAEISEITARVPNIRELLDLVLTKAVAATHARRGTVMLVKEDGKHLEVISFAGWMARKPDETVPVEDSVAGRVIESGRPMLIEDIEKAPGIERSNDWDIYSSPSFLIMPLNTKTGTIGAVCLSEKATGGTFNSHDQQFLMVLLGQVGYAVENARLLKQAREFAHDLKRTVVQQKKEIQEAHRQILQAEKLSALGQLAGGVAHDFNNLLQAVLGYTMMAQRGLPTDDKRAMALEQVRRAAEKASTLTGQLLAFGRRQMLQPVNLDLDKLVGELSDLLGRFLGESVELALLRGEILKTVHADPRQIEQVIMNLCINARDAMPDGGTVTIETRNVSLDHVFCSQRPWAQPGPYVCLSVSDTGCGMDEKVLNRIFEPFYTTKEPGKGTGLGLSTAYGIVRQHTGLIDVTSEPGKGTRFDVYLPVARRPVEEKAETKREYITVGGMETVLVAEDDEFVLNWSAQILEEAGYTVLKASDGDEAMRVFRENTDAVDMLVIDAVMPKLNGREICERARAMKPEVGVLFCSGHSSDIIPEEFMKKHGFQLLLKPFEPNDLLRKIRDTLDTAYPGIIDPS